MARVHVPLPIGGVNTAIPPEFIDFFQASDSRNVYVRDGLLRKRKGYSILGTAVTTDGPVYRIAAFYDDPNIYIVRMRKTKLEFYNQTTQTWANITTGLTTSDTGSWDYAFPNLSGSKLIVMTNGVDAIQKWDGNTGGALGGSPPKAKYCLSFGDYLLLANITDDGAGNQRPQRVQWPDTGDPENWSSGNFGSVNLADDGRDITGIYRFGIYCTVHKETSIYVGYNVSTSQIFRFERKDTGAGAVSFKTIKNTPDGRQLFLSLDGLRYFDGVAAPLVDSPGQNDLRRNMNLEYIDRADGIIVPSEDEYWLAVPTGSSAYPTSVYRYNYKTGAMHRSEYVLGDGNLNSLGIFQSTNQRTWDELSGSWDSQTWLWDDVEFTDRSPRVAFGFSGGNVFAEANNTTDSTTAIDAYWDSKDFTAIDLGGSKGQLVRWNKVMAWARGNSLEVQYSVDKGSTWNTITTWTLSGTYPSFSAPLVGYFDIVAEHIRFRFKNDVLDEYFDIREWTATGSLREFIR